MELDKKRYSQKEVALIFDAYKKEYEKRFFELRARINELINENESLKTKLDKSNDKEALILSVLTRAEKTALDLEKRSQLEYDLELERLKNFSSKWEKFFEEQAKKIAKSSKSTKTSKNSKTSKTNKKVETVRDYLKSVAPSASSKQIISEIDKLIESDKKLHPAFDPKKKVGEYIAATTKNGFNMDEVLNPGELKLEDICKELGLID